MRLLRSPHTPVHLLRDRRGAVPRPRFRATARPHRVPPVDFRDLSNTAKEESSASIKVRVDAARDIQNKRFANTGITCNAQIPPEMLHEVCRTAPAADALLKNAFEKFGLSARAYDRVLKVSRTIADLDNSRDIEARHAAEAVRYRTLDRKYWTR